MKVNKISLHSWCLILSVGEELLSSLKSFARFYEIPSGYFQAIGALKDVQLGYYDPQRDQYLKKSFDHHYELLSCQGNITYLGDDIVIHAHGSFAGPDFKAFGGHIFQATVAVTAEIFLEVGQQKLYRTQGQYNFNLIDPFIGTSSNTSQTNS